MFKITFLVDTQSHLHVSCSLHTSIIESYNFNRTESVLQDYSQQYYDGLYPYIYTLEIRFLSEITTCALGIFRLGYFLSRCADSANISSVSLMLIKFYDCDRGLGVNHASTY